MFKKRQIKKQNVDIEFERNENRVENTNSSEEEDIVVVVAKAVKKKVKQNYLYEDVEELKDNVKDLIDAEMEDFKYKSNANLTGNRRDLATVYNEIDTEETVDAHAIALKRMEIS